MKNSMWKKGLVLGIMLLFIGASVVSSNISIRENENVQLLVNQSDCVISNNLWDYNWSYYRTITINHNYIDTSLSNFPVLVVINSTIGAKCDGGNSIRFYNTDNTTELAYEIELWNTFGNSYVWVNVTSISSSTDTTFLMYYNNSDASDNQNSTGVWDSGFVGVWHMNDNTTSSISDSTSYHRDGTKQGVNTPFEDVGIVGFAQNFNNNYIRIGDLDVRTNDFCYELWIYIEDYNHQNQFYYRYPDFAYNEYLLKGSGSNTVLVHRMRSGSESQNRVYLKSESLSWNENQWYYLASAGDRDSSGYLYRDGQSLTLTTNKTFAVFNQSR